MNNLLHKSTSELTAIQEKEEAEKLGNAYFICQKLAGKLPGLISKIRDAILENHDVEKGSITFSIKNHNNSIRGVKSIKGTGGRHATSNISGITKTEALLINKTLKGEITTKFTKTNELLVDISNSLINNNKEEMLERLSQDIQKWEFTPRIRIFFFSEVRKITKAFRDLNLKGKRLIKSQTRLRYESVVIDLVCKKKLPGLNPQSTEKILSELSTEIKMLEKLCGIEIHHVLADVKQLSIFDKKLIESQNNLSMSCQKQIHFIVQSYARRVGLSDSEKDDIMQDMHELVISQALYHFDGRFKLKTYLNRYFDQCKTMHRKKKQMLPLRSKVTKHSRLYYEAKKHIEATERYVTSKKIADYVNRINSKANADCETVDEFFNLGTVSLDAALGDEETNNNLHNFLVNDTNISEVSPYSPMHDTESKTIDAGFEKTIYDFISEKFSNEYANLYTMRHGLMDNNVHTYTELIDASGYSKDLLRRRFIMISEELKKQFADSL